MATVLVVDDNETHREGVAAVCQRMKHEVLTADSGQRGLERVKESHVDLVLTDLKMDGLDGMGLLKAIKAECPEVAVIVMTGYGTIDTAVEAMRLGAFDFVTKPLSVDVVRAKVERALAFREMEAERERLTATREVLSGAREQRSPDADGFFQGMVGASGSMRGIFAKIAKVAPTDTNVLITGESGTGKELVADAVHSLSRRKDGPIIKVNCGAIPETLIESELFGHERGAFTGAIKRKLGRFELASGGTIFLDEVGELPLSMQVKLLRVLQEREIERVGGERPLKVDVRVLSATNRNLEDEVKEGRFREDLFYRLHIVPIHLPPLRERTDDIVPLARHFVDKLRGRTNPDVRTLTAAAEEALRRYPFPGNIRELENIVEQALVFSTPPAIDLKDLPPQVSGAPPTSDTIALPSLPTMGLNEFLESAERQMILAAYEASGGVKTETARRLKIKTSALYYKLEKYGIGTVAGRELGDEAAPIGD